VAEALAEIKKGAGTHFDPKVVQLLLQLCEQGAMP